MSGRVAYSLGRSLKDVHPRQSACADFEELKRAIEDAPRVRDKQESGYFCGPMGGDGRRCMDNVQRQRWLAVDLDRVDSDQVDRLFDWFSSRYSALAWTTHSSTPAVPRYRVLVELDRPAAREDCTRLGKQITEDLTRAFGDALKIDPATFKPEQAVLLPPEGVQLRSFGHTALCVDETLSIGTQPLDAKPAARLLTEEGQQSFSVPLLSSSVSLLSAVAATTPTCGGERNATLFEFARKVKAIDPNASKEARRRACAMWHEAALPFIRTEDFAITFNDFERGWTRVEWPHGTVLRGVLGEANSAPSPAKIDGLRYGPKAELLVRICAAIGACQ